MAIVVALALAVAARAESPAPTAFDPARHMRVAEVKNGMKGYGLSVFQGTKIERFEVEVISVLRNFNPKYDVVLVRASGANLEHTGGVAGMSGSPVFLRDDKGRDRMIGAFAYGWQAAKDPLAGVQPIEYMLAMPKPAAAREAANETKAVGKKRGLWMIGESFGAPWNQGAGHARKLSDEATKRDPSSTQGRLRDEGARPRAMAVGFDSSELRPLATPVMASGLPQPVLDQFAPMLRRYGMMPVQAGGAGADASGRYGAPATLEPGAAIAVPIVTGDMDMTAIGTVTEVIDGRVFAFGHAFFSEGEVSLPMGPAYIHSVIPSILSSFKLGSITGLAGTLQNDQIVGIAGKLGPVPATVPVQIRCVYEDGTSDLTYHFNVSRHQKLTPIAAGMATTAAVRSNRDLPQFHTVDYDFLLEFGDKRSLRVKNRSVNNSIDELLQMMVQTIQTGQNNPFERVMPTRIDGTVRVSREVQEAQIESVALPKEKFEPGDTLKLFVTYRPFRGNEDIMPLEFELPKDLPEGSYDFALLDWQAHVQDEQTARPFRFSAQSADEMFAVLRDVAAIRHDALYLRLLKQNDGVAIGRTAMSHLPSSRRKIITDAGLSNTTTFVSRNVRIVPTDYVMTGQAHFQIVIERPGKPASKTPKQNNLPMPGVRPPMMPSGPAGGGQPPPEMPGEP
ncbi:MAG: hypothetical protein ACHRHE_08995 [Tepidisphaerales bacterium]